MWQYVVAALLENVDTRAPFQKWPLHITLSPIFATDHIAPVCSKLQVISQTYRPMTLIVDKRNLFGAKHNVPVLELAPHRRLSALHRDIYSTIEPFILEGSGTHWQEHYRPHITIRQHRQLPFQLGERVEVRAFSLFEYTDRPTRTKSKTDDFYLQE